MRAMTKSWVRIQQATVCIDSYSKNRAYDLRAPGVATDKLPNLPRSRQVRPPWYTLPQVNHRATRNEQGGFESVLRPVPGERLNTITHALGLLLSLIGSVALMTHVVAHHDLWRTVGCGVYAFALVGVYANSTLSHSASIPRWKRMFRRLDQAFIYLLIVGSYTPFAVTHLRSGFWLGFLMFLWSIALAGFFSKVLMAHRVDSVAIWIYVTLGWLPIISAVPMLERAPAEGLWWLLAGGICYTVGTLFLVNDERVVHFHAVWHLFVIAGSACHFYAIWRVIA